MRSDKNLLIFHLVRFLNKTRQGVVLFEGAQ